MAVGNRRGSPAPWARPEPAGSEAWVGGASPSLMPPQVGRAGETVNDFLGVFWLSRGRLREG